MVPVRTSIAVHGILAVALLSVGATFVAVAPAAAASCLLGSGTSSDPFLVASAADLAKVGADAPNGCTLAAHYRQTADITLAPPVAPDTSNHVPIGSSSPFTGVYDGSGHSVDGVVLDTTAVGGTAFFADIRSGGSVRDLTLTGLSVSSTGGFNTAGLVGVIVDGDIRGVQVEGSVASDRNPLGGLVGYAERTSIADSSVTGTVSTFGNDPGGGDWVGGLVGNAIDVVIEDSRVAVQVFNAHYDGEFTGGLVGQLRGNAGRIVRSVATGSVAGYRFVGGIGGLIGDLGAVTSPGLSEVTSRADVAASANGDHVGGLAGAVYTRGSIVDTSSFGAVTVQPTSTKVAALVGYATQASIQRSIATGAVSGTVTDVGGAFADVVSASVSDVLWNIASTGQPTSDGGSGAIGATTAQLTSLSTYASWPIVDGWAPYDRAANRVWGICPRVNDGYPFLLWEYAADPCTVPVAASPSLSVACVSEDGGPLTAGVSASCMVSGADPGIDLVWRAAYNPVFAEGVVRTGADGTGTFSFAVPVAAAGSPVTVELVAWTAPIPMGMAVPVVGGPVPSSVQSGGGPVPVLPAVPLFVAVVVLLRTLRCPTAISGTSNA